MKTTDQGMDQFPNELTAKNTFICGQNASILTVATAALAELNADGKTLYVTDPYLFPESASIAYEAELVTLLKSTRASRIVYCAPTKRNDMLYRRIEMTLQSVGIMLNFDSRLEACHDRFWYCPKTDNCVIFGTSLNGLGRRICRIDTLRPDETAVLKQFFLDAGIIT